MMKKSMIPIALVLAASAAMASAAPLAGGSAAAGQKKSAVCAGCHGVDGNSINPQFPKLAGQNAGYIYQQLQLFKSGKRNSPIMATMAGTVSEQDMKDLAAYFSTRKIKFGAVSNSGFAQQGAKIFNTGKVEAGVPACTACHGAEGLGNPAVGYPRISGQHINYIKEQLKAFRDGTRGSSPQAAIMHNVARGLSDHDIQVLAAYIAVLKPDQ